VDEYRRHADPGRVPQPLARSIPVGATTVECDGVCTVVLRDGLIARNEVGFDRSDLLAAIAEASAGVE
jgi:hypothetical protein